MYLKRYERYDTYFGNLCFEGDIDLIQEFLANKSLNNQEEMYFVFCQLYPNYIMNPSEYDLYENFTKYWKMLKGLNEKENFILNENYVNPLQNDFSYQVEQNDNNDNYEF